MDPVSTSWAPYHNTPTTLAKIKKMAIAVSTARALARALAAAKERSTALPKRAPAAFSWVKV